MKALDKCCCDFTTLPADGESWVLWNLWGGYTASTPEIPKEPESVHWESTWRGGGIHSNLAAPGKEYAGQVGGEAAGKSQRTPYINISLRKEWRQA
jgi:hypothetical protein